MQTPPRSPIPRSERSPLLSKESLSHQADSSPSPRSRDRFELVLTFEDVTYNINDLYVLRQLNGLIKPGLTAVLGPPSCGKATFLSVLSARLQDDVQGRILVNGTPLTARQHQQTTGHVIEEDVLHKTMTVRQNLQYSANLRLPRHYTEVKKTCIVQAVIEQLGLHSEADVAVSECSWTSRRLCNIGMELVLSPSMLFLEDPTREMSPVSAYHVMEVLSNMAMEHQKTIVVAMARPDGRAFALFNHVIALDSGQLVYSGPRTGLLSYLMLLGHECQTHENPVDFLLYTIQSDPSLPQQFLDSQLYKTSLLQIKQNHIHTALGSTMEYQGERAGVMTQSRIITRYLLKKSLHGYAWIISPIVCAVLVAIAFGRLRDDYTGIQNREGVFFFMLINVTILTAGTSLAFVTDRKVFIHQYNSAYYTKRAYYLGTLASDVILIPSVIIGLYSTIVYFLVPFQFSFKHYSVYVFTLVLTAVTWNLLTLSMAVFVNTQSTLTFVTNLVFTLCMLFAGLLVNVASIVPFWSFLSYLSAMRYSFEILLANEISGLDFYRSLGNRQIHIGNTTTTFNAGIIVTPGDVYLETLGFSHGNTGRNIATLFVFMFVFFLVFSIGFCRLKENRKGNKYKRMFLNRAAAVAGRIPQVSNILSGDEPPNRTCN